MELYREHSPYEEETKQRTQRRDENKKKKSKYVDCGNRGKQTKYIHFCFKCGYLQSSALPHTSRFDAPKPNALIQLKNQQNKKLTHVFMNIFASPNIN